jgi:hypothetical protein
MTIIEEIYRSNIEIKKYEEINIFVRNSLSSKNEKFIKINAFNDNTKLK